MTAAGLVMYLLRDGKLADLPDSIFRNAVEVSRFMARALLRNLYDVVDTDGRNLGEILGDAPLRPRLRTLPGGRQ